MNKDPVIPVILCGGSGTRLWPLSRESFPKQYLKLDDSNDLSLIHTQIKTNYTELFSLKNDSNTIYHKMFYKKLNSGWPEFGFD